MAELKLNEDIGRSITRQDAAVQLAAIHTAQYGAELFRVTEELKRAQAEPESAEQQKRVDELKAKQDALKDARDEQVQHDQAQINPSDSNVATGAKEAFQDFIRAAQDGAQQMREITDNILAGINKNLVEELTTKDRRGPRHLWTNLGRSTAQDVTGKLLQKGEGSLMSALGLGSKTKPMHVIVDNNLPSAIRSDSSMGMSALIKNFGGTVGAAPSSLANPFNDAMKVMSSVPLPSPSVTSTAGASGSSFGSAASSVISKVLPFLIPGFADGTDNAPGGPSWVGENGPEIYNLPKGSTITPNNKISSVMGGGGDTHHYHFAIDARGATDPAQVDASARRAVLQLAPHIVHASVSKVADDKRRSTTR